MNELKIKELEAEYKRRKAAGYEDKKVYVDKKLVGSLPKGMSIGPGFLPVLKEEKKPVDEKYAAKYREYKELKDMRAEFEKEVNRKKRDDWDKYTKGPESTHKKGIELKQAATSDLNCEFSSNEVEMINKPEVKVSRLEGENNTLQAMSDKNKEAFLILREIYNSLDKVLNILK